MIWRLVVWVFLVAFAWWALRHREQPRRRAMPRGAAAGATGSAGTTLASPEAMLDCAHCGVHLPASEAVRDTGGRPYCCPEHREAGPRARA